MGGPAGGGPKREGAGVSQAESGCLQGRRGKAPAALAKLSFSGLTHVEGQKKQDGHASMEGACKLDA